jgi:hypothetical protein
MIDMKRLATAIKVRGNYRSTVDLQNNYPSTVVSIFKRITDLPVVSILRLSLRWHATGTSFVNLFGNRY